ncbi:dodecin family protein [Candidatus Nitrososphaera gargensis]|nr:dodecin family protein [Candidatus Nitrososphaera gargensis]
MATTREEPETTSSRVATVIEIIGTSNEGWEAAA